VVMNEHGPYGRAIRVAGLPADDHPRRVADLRQRAKPSIFPVAPFCWLNSEVPMVNSTPSACCVLTLFLICKR
jgi:hypothetical protein